MDSPEELEAMLREEAKQISGDVADVLSGHNISGQLWNSYGHVLIAGYFAAIEEISSKRGHRLLSRERSYIDSREVESFCSEFSKMGLFDEKDIPVFKPLFESVYYRAILHRQKYLSPLHVEFKPLSSKAHEYLAEAGEKQPFTLIRPAKSA